MKVGDGWQTNASETSQCLASSGRTVIEGKVQVEHE
jgi:hypothetical protein